MLLIGGHERTRGPGDTGQVGRAERFPWRPNAGLHIQTRNRTRGIATASDEQRLSIFRPAQWQFAGVGTDTKSGGDMFCRSTRAHWPSGESARGDPCPKRTAGPQFVSRVKTAYSPPPASPASTNSMSFPSSEMA